MRDQVKLLCGKIRDICLNTSKKLAFKAPAELSVYMIKNLVIINVDGIFNTAEIIAAKNSMNREKIILASHAVAEIWVNSVARELEHLLGIKPRTYFLDYRPECNTAMFVLYYDRSLVDEADEIRPPSLKRLRWREAPS
ncbi:MAG: Na-translocating system protein MpsC family protein [Bacillota bacterium]